MHQGSHSQATSNSQCHVRRPFLFHSHRGIHLLPFGMSFFSFSIFKSHLSSTLKSLAFQIVIFLFLGFHRNLCSLYLAGRPLLLPPAPSSVHRPCLGCREVLRAQQHRMQWMEGELLAQRRDHHAALRRVEDVQAELGTLMAWEGRDRCPVGAQTDLLMRCGGGRWWPWRPGARSSTNPSSRSS